MDITFPCGHEKIRLELPEKTHVLEPSPLPLLQDPEVSVASALRDPIESPPISKLAKGRKNACVVISDITRAVPNRVILPPLLRALEEAGIERNNILILIATGTHRPNEGSELPELVGEDIARTYRIRNHDCHSRERNRRIGELEGAPVDIDRDYLDADLKILTGLIEPHPYAGYSGGAKSILPGLSSLETMKFMHSFKMVAHPKVTNCVLDGNPFYNATLEVARLAGVDFVVNAVINKEKKLAGIFAGNLHGAHSAGCRMVADFSLIRMEEPADLVITSGGGAPMDATFYQCGKGLIVSKAICRKGGTVLMICGCAQGIGSETYTDLVGNYRSPEEFNRWYSDPKNFVMDQWAAQCYFQILNQVGEILIYSPGLTAEQLRPFRGRKIENLQEEVNRLVSESRRIAAIPQGPYVVGLVDPNS